MRLFCTFILFIFSFIAVAQAASQRDLTIQKEMDCVAKHLQQNAGLSWNDVCDVPESSSQERLQIINEQMDQVQGIIRPDLQKPNEKSEMVIDIAPQASYISYHEPSLGVKEKGEMYGVYGNITYRPKLGNHLNSDIADMYRLESSFSYGQVTYDGSNHFSGISDYLFEVRGLIGKDFFFNNQSTTLTPYAGGGYRHLFDGFYADKPGGYDRRIQYAYIPTGVEVIQQLNKGWVLEADMEYDFFIYGSVISYFGEIGYDSDAKNTQKHGYGLRGSLKLSKRLGSFNLFLEPYVRYWHIRRSDTTTFSFHHLIFFTATEPDNNSLEIGGRLGIEF